MDTGDSGQDTGPLHEAQDCSQVWGTGCQWRGDTTLNTACEADGEVRAFGEPGSVGGSGCACDSGSGGLWPMWLMPLVFLLARLAPMLLMAPAFGGVNAQNARVSDGGDWVFLNDADLGAPWSVAGWNGVSWTRDLVVLYDSPQGGPLLEAVTRLDTGSSVNLGGWARLGVVFPTISQVFYNGKKHTAQMGDLALWTAVPLTRPGRRTTASMSLGMTLPTGAPELYLGDAHGTSTLSFNWSFDTGPLRAMMNFGPRFQRNVFIPGGVWGSRWLYGLGLRAEPGGPFFVNGELFGAVPVVPWVPLPVMRPAEFTGTAGVQIGKGVALSAGGGTGLTRGLGSPSRRVVALLDLRGREAIDTDSDGIIDTADLCRRQPEDVDDFGDWDGCPDPDNDQDGFADVEDDCPNHPETVNGIDDTDGCPDGATQLSVTVAVAPGAFPPETVHLRIGERTSDVFVGEPALGVRSYGDIELAADALGFTSILQRVTLDQPEQAFVLTLMPVPLLSSTRSPLLDHVVRFEEDSTTLHETAALDDLAQWLLHTPELELLRVEAHADTVGDARYNYELSVSRARAIVDHLVDRGVDRARLHAIGTGEMDHSEGRVATFQVLVWADP